MNVCCAVCRGISAAVFRAPTLGTVAPAHLPPLDIASAMQEYQQPGGMAHYPSL